tara:strand:+ start:2973 stop:3371 length:399 start_codon:yes stop_codon:yes gene_type:complete
LLNFINKIINEDIDDYNILHFLKKIKHNEPLKSAEKAVPDLFALPMKIGNESKPIQIYKNYKKEVKYSKDILLSLIIQLRLGIIYHESNKILSGNINTQNSILNTIKKYISENNKKINYLHLKYLVKISQQD